MEQNGLWRRKNDEVASDLKKRMKLYGQQLQDLTLGVEGIFKGQLVSIVECQDCKHHSIRFESFLDLSLPVMEDKVSYAISVCFFQYHLVSSQWL